MFFFFLHMSYVKASCLKVNLFSFAWTLLMAHTLMAQCLVKHGGSFNFMRTNSLVSRSQRIVLFCNNYWLAFTLYFVN